MNREFTKVAVIAPNWLGDAVMSLPLIGFLDAAEGVHTALIAPRYTSRVYAGLREVGELVIVERIQGRLRRILRDRTIIAGMHADAVVVLPPSFSSAIAPFLARVPERVGYRTEARGWMFTQSVSAHGLRDEHLSENYLRLGRRLLKALRIEPLESFSRPEVRVFSNERQALDTLLERSHAPAGEFIVVVPGATYGPAKSWPSDSFKQLIEIISQFRPVIVAGGKDEAALCDRIGSGLANVHNLAGETSIGEWLALLERAELVIANDSAAPHAAASLGTPVIVLFGSTSPLWTSPLGGDVDIIKKDVPCAPCFLRECPTQLECFLGIKPEKVASLVESRLKKTVDNSSPA